MTNDLEFVFVLFAGLAVCFIILFGVALGHSLVTMHMVRRLDLIVLDILKRLDGDQKAKGVSVE